MFVSNMHMWMWLYICSTYLCANSIIYYNSSVCFCSYLDVVLPTPAGDRHFSSHGSSFPRNLPCTRWSGWVRTACSVIVPCTSLCCQIPNDVPWGQEEQSSCIGQNSVDYRLFELIKSENATPAMPIVSHCFSMLWWSGQAAQAHTLPDKARFKA